MAKSASSFASTERVKRLLLAVAGERATSWVQAVRFVHLVRTGRFRDPEVDLLGQLLRPGDVAVDVGANGANWTYYLHQAVGGGGAVFAFEADPYYARATAHAMTLLGLRSARLFPFGLSDRREQVALRVVNESGARVSGLGHVDRSAAENDAGVTHITLETLDSLAKEHPRLREVALLKCDVEGYEFFVFKGAAETIDHARPFVVLEVGGFEQHGYTGADLARWFDARNYAPFAMLRDGRLAATDDALGHPDAVSVNRVLVPRERLDRIADRLVPSGGGERERPGQGSH